MDFDSAISIIMVVLESVSVVISLITLVILAVQLGINSKEYSKKKKDDRQTPLKR